MKNISGFIILLLTVGGKRGLKSFFTLVFNMTVIYLLLTLISWSFNPILLTMIASLLISNIILFYQNGKNIKTLSAFVSILIIILFMISFTFFITYKAKLGGINEIMKSETIAYGIPANVNLNMFYIGVAVFISGLLGASIDTAITIASAIYEVYLNNQALNQNQLYESGISMGQDILGTTLNTLLFAFLGGGMSLFIFYNAYHYDLSEIINSKAFIQDSLYILVSGLSCLLVIPVTAFVSSYMICNAKKFNKFL